MASVIDSLGFMLLPSLRLAGVNALHMPASKVRQLFAGLYDCIADSVITTRDIFGTECFVAW